MPPHEGFHQTTPRCSQCATIARASSAFSARGFSQRTACRRRPPRRPSVCATRSARGCRPRPPRVGQQFFVRPPGARNSELRRPGFRGAQVTARQGLERTTFRGPDPRDQAAPGDPGTTHDAPAQCLRSDVMRRVISDLAIRTVKTRANTIPKTRDRARAAYRSTGNFGIGFENETAPGQISPARGGWLWRIPAMTDFRARGTIMGPAGLTAVFGMGTGVAPPVWSPGSRPAGGQAGPGVAIAVSRSRRPGRRAGPGASVVAVGRAVAWRASLPGAPTTATAPGSRQGCRHGVQTRETFSVDVTAGRAAVGVRAAGRGGQAVGCWDWSAAAVARRTLPAHRPGRLPGAFVAIRYRKPRLEEGFALRCLQRLSFPDLATRRCPERDSRHTRGRSSPILSY